MRRSLLTINPFVGALHCRVPLRRTPSVSIMAKRKRSTVVDVVNGASTPLPPPIAIPSRESATKNGFSKREDVNLPFTVLNSSTPHRSDSESLLSEIPELELARKKKTAEATPIPNKSIEIEQGIEGLSDPGADSDVPVKEEEIKQVLSRPPPVNSDYLPLAWKGRLGYACLNTYLRHANPPVFSSRTCRIASILDHRHPLQDPSRPEHPTKNRPDKSKPPEVWRGQRWVESLGLQNARDIVKMVRWNDKYGIKFMRLSSEMFPFATHAEYGYKLAPFASEVLAEAGKVIAELGHRVTTHPGQFTQLGSPRKGVIRNSIRDLEYHDEMLSLLKLLDQQDRDAVMILHMGGTFGSKEETLQRFRENYARLSESVRRRVVLENDDMGWSVHDLLPVCQELNIPLVLDFHHHNIVFDKDRVREGTKDIMDLFPAIRETWTRKGITQKMHYSEQTPAAITPMQRRKHSPRVMTLPPCAPDMDLMIEAKDKEQAVFELMRTFKLPGYDLFNDVIPHMRHDENKPARAKKATVKKKARKDAAAEEVEVLDDGQTLVPENEVRMGGPENRVYWPPGMEDWLKPKKREVKKKDQEEAVRATKPPRKGKKVGEEADNDEDMVIEPVMKSRKTPVKRQRKEPVPTPSTSDAAEVVDYEHEDIAPKAPAKSSRRSKRASKVNYAELEDD